MPRPSLQKMAAFAEISGAQTKIFQVQVHKNVPSAPQSGAAQIQIKCAKCHKSNKCILALPPDPLLQKMPSRLRCSTIPTLNIIQLPLGADFLYLTILLRCDLAIFCRLGLDWQTQSVFQERKKLVVQPGWHRNLIQDFTKNLFFPNLCNKRKKKDKLTSLLYSRVPYSQNKLFIHLITAFVF